MTYKINQKFLRDIKKLAELPDNSPFKDYDDPKQKTAQDFLIAYNKRIKASKKIK